MKKYFLLIAIVGFVASFGCKKKSKTSSNSNEKLFTYNSLKADKDTILQGNVTNLRASVSGQATITWSSSAGDIFGSGGVVLFGASTCCVGNHSVTCTATDANKNTESKTVVIYVHS